jgi:hypothetical protein
MTWQEWAKQFLLDERARKLKSIELLSSGSVGTSEMRNGKQIDTTNESITVNKEHVAELERLLTDARVPFDA